MGTFSVTVALDVGGKLVVGLLERIVVVGGKYVGVLTFGHLGSREVGPHLGGFAVETVTLVGVVGLVSAVTLAGLVGLVCLYVIEG